MTITNTRNDLRSTIRNEADAAAALLANIRSVIGDDEDARHDAIEGETSLIDVISAAILRCDDLEAMSDAIDDQIKKLKDRKSRFDNQIDLLRTAVCSAMQVAELKRLELPTHTLTVKKVPDKVIVTSEEDVPTRFFVTPEPKLSLKALGDALRAGDTVPGALLSNGGLTLQIKGG